MMKRFSLLLLVFGLSFLWASAQSNNSPENILDKSSAKIRSAKGINVSFSLTQKDERNQVVSTSNGNIKIKGAKYYIKQGTTEIICNGIQIWNFDGHDEVSVSKVDKDDNDFSPQQILTGFNKKDFNIRLLSSTSTVHQVQLTPVDKRQNFKQVILFINKSSYLISKASFVDKMNATTEISFSNFNLNASFTDNQFVFDAKKHPGIDIINN